MGLVKIAVLISGNGSNLQALIDEIHEKNKGEIVWIMSDKSDAYGIERGKKAGIPSAFFPKDIGETNTDYHGRILNELEAKGVQLVVLAGYLKVISEEMVKAYPGRIINIHPSLIPMFCGKGYYGIKVHEGVLARGVKVTGATVHIVDTGTDTGPILLQEAVAVRAEDTAESLQKRVLEVEHSLLVRGVSQIIEEIKREEMLLEG